MSGGSFNYLCRKDLSDLVGGTVGEEWDHMLDELDEICPKAAEEMRKIRQDTKTFREMHEDRWCNLQGLLHSIEWWRSNDYGEDQVDEAIEIYLEKERES